MKPVTYKHLHCAPLVSQLHTLLQSQDYENAVIEFERIRADLPTLATPHAHYNRHVLSIENGHWLLILNWATHAKTPVHGHPDVAFVYVVSGAVRCIDYAGNPLQQTQTQIYQTGDMFHSVGERGKFNNAIHQLSTDAPAQTLHFYSDDISKSCTYS